MTVLIIYASITGLAIAGMGILEASQSKAKVFARIDKR